MIQFCGEEGLILLADEVYQANTYQDELPFHSFRKILKSMPEWQDVRLLFFFVFDAIVVVIAVLVVVLPLYDAVAVLLVLVYFPVSGTVTDILHSACSLLLSTASAKACLAR